MSEKECCVNCGIANVPLYLGQHRTIAKRAKI